MKFEENINISNSSRESELAQDTQQAILDLIKLKNYGGLDHEKIDTQLFFIKKKIKKLYEDKDPLADELNDILKGNFGGFKEGGGISE